VNGICEAVESEPTTCDRPTSMLTPATTDKNKTQKKRSKRPARPLASLTAARKVIVSLRLPERPARPPAF
jgi:hypothetical protein